MKQEKYRICSHTFKGRTDYTLSDGKPASFYTYEITFNKSLEHTLKIQAIADGLNRYDKKDRKKSKKNG